MVLNSLEGHGQGQERMIQLRSLEQQSKQGTSKTPSRITSSAGVLIKARICSRSVAKYWHSACTVMLALRHKRFYSSCRSSSYYEDKNNASD